MTEANKAIKNKEVFLKQQEVKIIELEKYVKQIKGLGQEETGDQAMDQGASMTDENLMKRLQEMTQVASMVEKGMLNPELGSK